MKKRALLSVYDKTRIVSFAEKLIALNYQIISTGGTLAFLQSKGIKAMCVTDITGFPECLDGRVKTLHPIIHGGILAMRNNPQHMSFLNEQAIIPIDIVAINLYPFRETVSKKETSFEMAIENIDIGGPTMLRSAAKNHKDVVVVVSPNDYDGVIEDLQNNTMTVDKKRCLALKVFEHTAHYDAMISDYLRKNCQNATQYPEKLTLAFDLHSHLRYGENPHQKAVFYKDALPTVNGLASAEQLHGKALSFNNLNDAQAAIACIKDFDTPTCVAVKHTNPCGVGCAKTIEQAYIKAYEADSISIFGGVLAFNRRLTQTIAQRIADIFIEIVIAPDFSEDALKILTKKKNIRLLKMSLVSSYDTYDVKRLDDGVLLQDIDMGDHHKLEVVTKNKPSKAQMIDLLFANKLVKHLKSNAIAIVKNGQSLGMGPGQVNRIWAAENAIRQSGERISGAVMASDAFFPFSDVIEVAGQAGITAIIQPGGSINDQKSIDKADELGIVMIFTGTRHFKH